MQGLVIHEIIIFQILPIQDLGSNKYGKIERHLLKEMDRYLKRGWQCIKRYM